MRFHFPAALPRPWQLALLGVAVFATALAGIELTRINGRIASVWFANAILLAALVRAAPARWPLLIAVATTGNFLADLAVGDDVLRAAALTSVNMLETLVVAAWATRGGRRVEFESSAGILNFVVAACGTGTILSALVAAGVLSAHLDTAAFDLFANWYLSDSLGLLVVTPLLVLGADLRDQPNKRIGASAWSSVLVGIGAVIVFAQAAPLLFLLLPLLVVATYRTQLVGALMALSALIAVAIGMTISGIGPIATTVPDPLLRNYLLQGFIAAMVFMVLPMRALLGERDRLHVRLAEGERMFHRIAEASPAGILYLDADGRAGFANQRWSEMAGSAPTIGECDRWTEVVEKSARSQLRSLWSRARVELAPCEAELPLAGSGGRWVQLHIFPEVSDGIVQGFVVRMADVTTRRRAEAALHDSEALYRLVTENSSDLVLRVGLDGTLLYASSAARRLLGRGPVDLVGQRLVDLASDRDTAAVTTMLQSADDPMASTDAQFRMKGADGEWRWIEASRRLVVDPTDGWPSELVVTLRDVDRRRRSELATVEALDRLRESNRLLAMSGRLGGVEPWRWDLPTARVELPSRLVDVLGIGDPGKPLGKSLTSWLSLVEPADRRQAARLFARARREGMVHPSTIRIRRHDGKVRHLHIAAQLDRADSGADRALVGVVRDVSDEVRARMELMEARDAAEAAASAKGNFLATMSHEIRTPLTGVIGMIDLLRSDPDSADRDLYLSTLKQSADLLLTVLDDVLDFSKMESGALELDERDFDIASLAQGCVALFANAASRKGLTVRFDNRCRTATTAVRSDATRLQQVLANFLSNAIKFTEAGEVVLRLSGGGGDGALRRFRVEVCDTGIGIDPTRIASLFRPFAQAEASTSRRFGGTGLGLAIAGGLVRALGGRIEATSTPGKGSCFAIDLDLAAAQAPVASPASQPAEGARASTSLTVLVAEDNPVNQLLIGAFLRRAGHRVECADNGHLALAAAAERRFDVIIMDMQMPEMDGLAATRAIRRGDGPNAQTPIIALTADASPERRRFYDGAGLSAFLTKPIDEEALARTIADVRRGGGPIALPTVEAGAPTALPILDEGRLDELAQVLGSDRVDQLLDLLADQCRLQPARLVDQARRNDRRAIAASAHSIKGAAESVGALALGAAARTLEDADGEEEVETALDSLRGLAAATCAAIQLRLASPGRETA